MTKNKPTSTALSIFNDPISYLSTVQNNMRQMFDNFFEHDIEPFFNPLSKSFFSDDLSLFNNYDFDHPVLLRKLGMDEYPKLNMINNDNDYEISAAVPGLEKDDISITISNVKDSNHEPIEGVKKLTIKGKKVNETEDKNKKYIARELKMSSWGRTICFNENDVELDKMEAEMKDGLLKIIIPKVPKKEKEIEPSKEEIKQIKIK